MRRHRTDSLGMLTTDPVRQNAARHLLGGLSGGHDGRTCLHPGQPYGTSARSGGGDPGTRQPSARMLRSWAWRSMFRWRSFWNSGSALRRSTCSLMATQITETTFNVSTLGRRRPNDHSQGHQETRARAGPAAELPAEDHGRTLAGSAPAGVKGLAALGPYGTAWRPPLTPPRRRGPGERSGRRWERWPPPTAGGPQPAGCSRDSDAHRLEGVSQGRAGRVKRSRPCAHVGCP